MKTVKLIAALMLVLAAMGAGCSGKGNVRDDIAVAHQAVADGDYPLARQSLQSISAQLNDSTVSPTLLSEVALLYMVISDNTADGSDDDMKALETFRHAVKINRDSVNAYMRTLPPDEAKFLFLLDQLNNAMDNACQPGIMEEGTEMLIEAEAEI